MIHPIFKANRLIIMGENLIIFEIFPFSLNEDFLPRGEFIHFNPRAIHPQ